MSIVPGFEDFGTSQEIFDLVWRDDLTGLFNRRFFARYMKQVADWSEGGPPVCLAMMDMDNLKRINDRLGHLSGDTCLKQIGTIMLEVAPEGCYPIRYAGDEFCLVMPSMSRAESLELADELRQRVAKDSYEGANLPDGLRPSLSIGVAAFPEDAPAGGDDLTETADKALYHSKRTGKNKVTSAADLLAGSETISDIEALSGFPSQTLFGREDAFATIDEAVSLAKDGKTSFLLVEGAAGTGKTRLLSELAKYADERELAVWLERCNPVHREDPYRTLAGLLESYLRADRALFHKAQQAISPPQRIALREIVPVFRPRRPPPSSGARRRDDPSGSGVRRPLPDDPSASGVRRAPPDDPSASGVRRPLPDDPSASGVRRPLPDDPSASGVRRPLPDDPSASGVRSAPPDDPSASGVRRPPPRTARMKQPPTSKNLRRGSDEGRPLPPTAAFSRGAPRRGRPGGPGRGGRRQSGRMGRRPPPHSGRGRRAPRMDPAELTANLFSGLQAVLRALAAHKTLVVILDDLDAADEPTFEVIRAMLGGAGGVLFVGAARSRARDMKDTPYAGFREAITDQTFFSVELNNLEQEQTRALAKTLLDGFAPPDRLFAPIYEVSEGNPLFVEGVLRHLIDAQLLQRTEDGWAVAEALPEEIPLTLEEVLRQQLAILDPATAALLRDAAVIGPNFDFNVLKISAKEKAEAEAEGAEDDDDTLTLVDEAEQAQIIRKTGGDEGKGEQLEFTSRAAQETSYAEQEDKPGAHARVAEAIEQEQPQEAGALAYHFGKAGNEEQRERFLERVRERREQLFNRDTIETILGAGSNLPEVSDEPTLALTAQLPRLAKSLANAAKVVRLYPRQSKSVQDAATQLVQTLEKAHEHAPSFTIGHRGNAFTLNGHAVDRAYATGEYQEAVVGIYRTNSIKSLTFLQTASEAELIAFLEECAKHTVAVPLERYFWRVFAKEHDVTHLGVAQKTRALTRRDGHSTGGWKRPTPAKTNEEQLPILREVILHFMGTLRGLKDFPPDHDLPTKGKAALDRALRQFFQHAPGLALHMGSAERDELVVNGEALPVKSLGGSAAPLRHFLRDTRLAGLVILKEITPRELSRFLDRVSQLPPRAKPEDEDPAAGIGADGSFPNVVVGEALFELAHGLVRGRAAAQTGKAELEVTLDDAPPIEELLPLPERDPDLPHDFKWPSEEAFQRAHRLWGLKPAELLQTVSAAEGEFGDCLERLMLEERHEARAAARLLVERLAINLSSQEARDRKKVAEAFVNLTRQGTGVVRERYHAALLVRLADALELETDASVFEKLAECAKAVILARIADGQWDEAARLTRSLGLRRTTRSDQQEQLKHTSRLVLGEILRDPRIERLFETIEGGSHQERRKAARVLETMGDAAVERLVEALKATERSRVENFLIDMLAALVPTSENALRKEVTPSSAPEPTIKLLRASGVVCRDATPVFIAGLSHDDQTVQSAALTEARKLGGRVAQQVLVWALAHGTAQVQLESVKHLGDLARPEAVEAMIALAQTTTLVEVQRECCLAFGKLALSRSHSEKVVNVLASFLSPGLFRKDYHEDVRHAAAWALGQMTDNEVARRTLNKALDDKDKRVRLTARLTLEGKQQP